MINEQFGFRKNHSTAHGVLNLSNYVINELDKGNFCIGLFMDLSKAFDTIDHHILLDKLCYYGVRGVALNWFRSYLIGRKQFVMVDGVSSDFKELRCGVPQGSVLGPLLFLIYVNDIISSSKLFRFSLFADDTVTVLSHKNVHTLISLVNPEISKIVSWFQNNKLHLNYEKTKFILFRSKNRRVPPNLDSICIHNTPLQGVKSISFLGVTIDEFLSWKAHVKNVTLKVSRGVGILSKLRYIVPDNVLMLLYNTIILPHLSYCSIVWGNSYSSHLNEIKLLQNKAIRIITNSEYKCSSNPLFIKMKVLPIQQLITLNTLIFMYNFHSGHLPLIFKTMFVINSSVHPHKTRQRMLLHKPPVRTTHALNSFQNMGINRWNDLNLSIKSSTTLTKFKKLCKKELFTNLKTLQGKKVN